MKDVVCIINQIDLSDGELKVLFITGYTGQSVMFISNLGVNEKSKLKIMASSPGGLVDHCEIHIKESVKSTVLNIDGEFEQQELTAMLVAFQRIKKTMQELAKEYSY